MQKKRDIISLVGIASIGHVVLRDGDC